MAGIKLENLGAYELMQILHELHKLGYQKLRWMSYMAPTGLALRCHITRKIISVQTEKLFLLVIPMKYGAPLSERLLQAKI